MGNGLGDNLRLASSANETGDVKNLGETTLEDVVAGPGLTFEDAGEHELKGVPDRWRLFRVVA
jgi:hypothetical protein